ncbi:DUF3710 domain-containing protein [Leucobacter sp. CSA1]|uniref:DUF3710 domain-containing protein n=1 Tax=Leucobacter chromiisoli TaxID=2796471 RepID=A0A934Q6P1_9MICO|nr:DUF3710 domain-containing protein [Leucobacter chromiisoli]MBK0418066.1 DUF3710 domain-containing protein [Leucobacter chromiisoli]
MSDETQGADEIELRDEDAQDAQEVDESKSAPEDRATAGPFDVSEVPGMRPYVDLGGIKVAPREGLQLRLDVDEKAKRVVAVSLNYAESLMQVQAFSAPKSTGLWNQVRSDIAAQTSAQGAEVAEEAGPLGPELVVRSAAPAEQGGGTRVVRFIGVDGPRWMLRGVVMGRAAVEEETRARVIELFRELVVVRGDQPMPPSELLPLQVPAGVQQSGQAQGPVQGQVQGGVQEA